MSSWLHDHINTFVRPILGYVPRPGINKFFTDHELSVMKNMWRSVKRAAAGRRILLAGRDVWVFEVLARRENFPTIFRPDISRATANRVAEDYSQLFIFDTGFVGSIPRALNSQHYLMASASTQSDIDGTVRQVFPHLKGARSLALKIESTPKYWKHGYIQHSADCAREAASSCSWMVQCSCGSQTIMQPTTGEMEFATAAQVTIEIYTNNAPRLSEGNLKAGRWQSTVEEWKAVGHD